MKRACRAVLVPLTLLSTAMALPAQDKKTTSPIGWDSKEGLDSARTFGNFPAARYQFADGEFKGKGAKSLKQVGYRHDWQHYIVQTGMGRKWGRVRLSVADCDYDKLNPSWKSNPSSTPTKVFDSAVTWPSMSGFPGTGSGPAAFVPALAFPFSSSWSYDAKSDLLLDFSFDFGALHNGGSWPISSERPYNLDTVLPILANLGGVNLYGSLTCTDSGQGVAAVCYPSAATFAATTGNPSTANKHRIYTYSFYTARGAGVVHALGMKGSSTGLVFPGACNKLHVDPLGPTVYILGKADSARIASFSTFPQLGHFPYVASAVGLPLWCQAGWEDSVTRRFMLSRAGKTSIPSQPPNPPRRSMQYAYGSGSQVGSGFSSHPRLNAVAQYVYR